MRHLPRRAAMEGLETRRLLAGNPVPFHGTPFNVATDTIQAEDFDNGGEGVAYNDSTPQNIPGKYRSTGVDVAAVANASNGFAVGYTAAGEWLNYTINAPSAGGYAIQARVASFRQGGTFHVEFDGANVTGTMTVPDTGPWDTWQTITSRPFNLSAGTHQMRLVMERGGYWGAIGDFDSFRFVSATVPPPTGPTPFLGHPFDVATDTIEAENFDNGGEGVSFHDTTPANLGGKYRTTAVDVSAGGSNGFCVGYTAPGEWLRYTIDAPAAGTYVLAAQVAFLGPGGTFHAEIDGANVSGTMTVPNTGGWLNWQTVTSAPFQLSAGTHAMRIVMDRGGSYGAIGDFDSFRFMSSTTPPAINYTWTTAAPAPLGLTEAESAAVGGKMYVFGGYYTTSPNWLATTRAEVYDLASNTWSAIADVPSPFTHGGCTADDRYVYLAGGYITNYSTGQQTFATRNVWRYDTVTNTWAAMTPLPQARGTGALALVGRTLHFFGGADINRVDRPDHWTLNLDDPTAAWQTSVPLPSVRNHMGATVLNGKIYTIGGQVGENDDNPTVTCLVFDPATNQWSSIANLPTPRSHIAGDTFVMNGQVVIVAGVSTGGSIVGNVTAYDPATNTWRELTPLPQPRHSSVAKFINGHLVASTGYWNGLRTDTWVSSLIG